MEQQSVDKLIVASHWPRMMAATALGMLALFLAFATLSELKSYRFIGSGVAATNTISVTGEGTVFAVPDVATFSVSVSEFAKDVTTAQTTATTKANDIIEYLKGQGVKEEDIQTTDYNISPHYEYSAQVCPAGSYCPGGKQTLTGYDVTQTLTVKVRDTKKAGDLLSGAGSRGASNVSGLDFTVADQDLVEAQARDKAIAQAKDKADRLARSLGVHIVRIVGFQESGQPIYYAKATSYAVADGRGAATPAPQIPTGTNKIVSDVTVTYEIE